MTIHIPSVNLVIADLITDMEQTSIGFILAIIFNFSMMSTKQTYLHDTRP